MADSNMLRKEIYKELRTQIEPSRKRVYDIIILLQSALDTKELFFAGSRPSGPSGHPRPDEY